MLYFVTLVEYKILLKQSLKSSFCKVAKNYEICTVSLVMILFYNRPVQKYVGTYGLLY